MCIASNKMIFSLKYFVIDYNTWFSNQFLFRLCKKKKEEEEQMRKVQFAFSDKLRLAQKVQWEQE